MANVPYRFRVENIAGNAEGMDGQVSRGLAVVAPGVEVTDQRPHRVEPESALREFDPVDGFLELRIAGLRAGYQEPVHADFREVQHRATCRDSHPAGPRGLSGRR